MNSKILKIGLELECEGSDELQTELSTLGTIKGDGSLDPCGIFNHKKDLFCLEFVTPPIQYKAFNKYLDGVLGKLEAMPNDYHFNKSCGYHMHVSFKPEIYPFLCTSEFYNFFMHRLRRGFTALYEERKANRYCKAMPAINDKYLLRNQDDRYQALNFFPALQKHKTIEFRIFKADTPENLRRYSLFTVRTINEYLNKPKPIIKEFTAETYEQNEVKESNIFEIVRKPDKPREVAFNTFVHASPKDRKTNLMKEYNA